MRQMWNRFRRRFSAVSRQEDGNVLLIVAFSMVALCGFTALVTDVGMLYVYRQQIQASADAGALAGADELLQGPTAAADTAYQLARQNDGQSDYSAVADAAANKVTVTGSRKVNLWFAKALGITTATVRGSSTAAIGTLTAGVGMVPIAVPQQSFTYGQEIYLSEGSGNGQSGNYGFLDFSGNGANGLEYDIEHGYDFPLSVGEQVPTKPGVNDGPVSTAIQYRLQEDADDSGCASFDTATSDCARVMYLPIVDSLNVNGKKSVTIVGFAAFYLEGLQGNGGHQQIVGRFIRMVRDGTLGSGTDFGTYAVRLIH